MSLVPRLIALLLLAALGLGDAQAGTTREFSIKPGQIKREYRVYQPAGLDPSKPVPLVISAHGAYGTGKSQQEISGWDALADRYGFIVAYPDGIWRAWNAGDLCCGVPMEKKIRDVDFLRALVEQVARDYNIDRRRVYGNGYSNGGMLMHYAACEDPGLFAAIATNASTLATTTCKPKSGTPVLMIRGLLDERMPWDGGVYEGASRMGMLDVARIMAANNHCPDTTASITLQSGPTTCWTIKSCGTQEVSWCGIAGVGHQWIGGVSVWPGKLGPNTDQFSSTQAMWDFFSRH